jgi:hypothetical protein
MVYRQFTDLRDDAPDMHISRPTWIVDVSETRSREDILRQHKLNCFAPLTPNRERVQARPT